MKTALKFLVVAMLALAFKTSFGKDKDPKEPKEPTPKESPGPKGKNG